MSAGGEVFPGMDVMRRGYFGCPAPAPGTRLGSDAWAVWLAALDAAKRGDFTLMPHVLDLYDPRGDYRLNRQCMLLLGDAGPGSCFAPIVAALTHPADSSNYEIAIDHAHAVANRGRLDDVPALLTTFERYRDVQDADILPVLIDRVLARAPGDLPDPDDEEELAVYKKAVLEVWSRLIETHGQDAVFFRGEPVCIRRIAMRLIKALRQPYFSFSWRQKFEAFTGVDCSAFYKDGNLQPLAAAALVEDFLESDEANKFEPGVRYFFGHRVPD